MSRKDGRTANQIRGVQCEYGLLQRAHGSVRYSQGKTRVLVGVFGPLQASNKQERIDRAVLEVSFDSLSGHHVGSDTERASVIRSALEAVVLLQLHPRTKISLTVQVEHDDGGLLATCLNAATLALVDAGVQCNAMLAAVCLAVPRSTEGEGASDTLLDPLSWEAEESECVLTFAFSSNGGGVVTSDCTGVVQSEEAYLEHMETAKRASDAVQSFFKLSLAKKLEKEAIAL